MTPFSAEFRSELLRLLQTRRDVRRFLPDAPDPEALNRALDTFPLAPSVGLSEPWRLVRVESAAARAAALANFDAANKTALTGYDGDDARRYASLKLTGMDQAPVHLAVFCDDQTTKGKGLGAQTMPEMRAFSCVTAITQLWLALAAEGIGMGWVSILDPVKLCRSLDVPDHWRLIGYFCIGYPETIETLPELQRLGWETRSESPDCLIR